MDGFATNVHIRRILGRGQTTEFLTLGTFAQLANFGPLSSDYAYSIFVVENPSREKFSRRRSVEFLSRYRLVCASVAHF